MLDRATTPILQLKGASKSFPGVKALEDVSLDVYAGEIHALMGENGAGKSTLLKIIFGAYTADSGEIWLNGHPATLRNPADALAQGVSMVHQEVSLVPQLSAVQNIVLGREKSSAGFINWGAARTEALAALRRLDSTADPPAPAGGPSAAQQQIIRLARAPPGAAQGRAAADQRAGPRARGRCQGHHPRRADREPQFAGIRQAVRHPSRASP